jgi:hypothetical protein
VARGRARSGACRQIALVTGVWLLSIAPALANDPAVFSVAQVPGGASGVAVLRDGSIIYSISSRHRVVRTYLDGRHVAFAGTGSSGDPVDGNQATRAALRTPEKLVVAADGTVLIADSGTCTPCARVFRITRDGKISSLAGRPYIPNRTSFLEVGDGGPATQAWLGGSWMSQLPDGGLLLADSQQSRVRRIHPDGTITTVAGTGVSNAYAGEGGPALGATLPQPADVASLSDGSFMITAANRVLRIAPDGTIRTVVRTDLVQPKGIAPAAGGGYLFADAGIGLVKHVSPAGQIKPLAGDRSLAQAECRYETPSAAGLFNGEGVHPLRAALCEPLAITRDPFGGWLIADARGISMLAKPGAARMGVAITRPQAGRRRLLFAATARGSARLEVTGPGRVVRVTRGSVRPGTNIIRLPKFPPGVSTVVLRARSYAGAVDEDRLGLLLGGRLPLWLGQQLIEGDWRFSDARLQARPHAVAADGSPEYVDRCRRFGPRRVDCVVRDHDYDACVEILYVRSRASGLLREGSYRCKRGTPFRQHIPDRSRTWALPLL